MNEFNSVEAAMVILKAKKESVMRVENQLSMCNYVLHWVPIKIESSSPLNNQIVQACAVLALCTHDTMHHSNKFRHHSRMVGNGIVTTTSTTMSSVYKRLKVSIVWAILLSWPPCLPCSVKSTCPYHITMVGSCFACQLIISFCTTSTPINSYLPHGSFAS